MWSVSLCLSLFNYSDVCLFCVVINGNWEDRSMWSVSLCLCHLVTLMYVYMCISF